MKHIKNVMFLLLTLVIAFSLTACVCETHTVNISSDGGSAIHEQIISKDTYNQLISMGSDVNELKEEGYTITFFSEDGEDYVKASKTYEFDDLNALERYFQELATSDEGSNSEKYFKSFNLKSKGAKITLSGEIGKPDASAVYTSCEIILKFDGKITDYSIGEKTDSNTLKLDLMSLWTNNSGEEFIIESDSGNFGFWGILLIIVLAFIAVMFVAVVLIIIFLKKNKKQNIPKDNITE